MNKEQTKTATQIGTLFILPVLLIILGIIPVQYRFFVLLTITIIVPHSKFVYALNAVRHIQKTKNFFKRNKKVKIKLC